MSGRRAIGVVIGAGPSVAVAEGLRAAVGLTLRGDRVVVAIVDEAVAAAGADAARAAATLALFHHPVRSLGRDPAAATAALAADVVELWAGAADALATTAGGPAAILDGPGARLHLLRPGRRVPLAAPRDAVLHLPSAADAAADDDDHHDAVLDAILAAGAVLVW